MHDPMTFPVSTSNAANKVVVPLRLYVSDRLGPVFDHRQ